MLELESRQPIIKTPPQLAWYPKGMCFNEWFLFEEHRKRVSGFARIPGDVDPHKLRRVMYA
jgi:hypothetical protein